MSLLIFFPQRCHFSIELLIQIHHSLRHLPDVVPEPFRHHAKVPFDLIHLFLVHRTPSCVVPAVPKIPPRPPPFVGGGGGGNPGGGGGGPPPKGGGRPGASF